MSALRACPFCRTLYRSDEGAVCTECGVALVPMHQLAPSPDADSDEELPAPVLPEDEILPMGYLGRGRGALLALAIAGVLLFFLSPWVEIVRPESAVRSGYDLARGRAGWLWGGVSGYLVLIPLVLTRRTIFRMRGVRIVSAMLASMTFFEVSLMWLLPPRGHGLVPVAIEWRWGLFASGFVSALATIVGARFGGALPRLATAQPPDVRPQGETLH